MSFLKLCFFLCGCHLLQAIEVKPVRSNGTASRRKYIQRPPYHTWVGMLVDKHSSSAPANGRRKTSTRIILINDAVAVGYAGDVNSWNPAPDDTQAMFWRSDGRRWLCGVDRYEVHPDFHAGTRTLALVFLVLPSPRDNWLPIAWPRSNNAPDKAIYIGINDEPGHVSQYWEDVVIYPKHECDSYYVFREGWGNYSRLAQHTCYVAPRFQHQRCWYFSGMALLYESHGSFYLFGVSTGGPGCFSPSRWIQFHPFREWIQDHSRPNLRSGNADQGMYDYYQDLDVSLLNRLFDRSMELRWASNSLEWVYGYCWLAHNHLMYREKTVLKTKVNGTIGTYSFSIYDRTYTSYTCVTLVAYCKRKTSTRWWFSWGFRQDDIDYYVRKVPYSINGTIAPKIIFLMDKYRKYHNQRVANIDFQFEFDIEAELDVQFYGYPRYSAPRPTTTARTTTTFQTITTTRRYAPFWGIGK